MHNTWKWWLAVITRFDVSSVPMTEHFVVSHSIKARSPAEAGQKIRKLHPNWDSYTAIRLYGPFDEQPQEV